MKSMFADVGMNCKDLEKKIGIGYNRLIQNQLNNSPRTQFFSSSSSPSQPQRRKKRGKKNFKKKSKGGMSLLLLSFTLSGYEIRWRGSASWIRLRDINRCANPNINRAIVKIAKPKYFHSHYVTGTGSESETRPGASSIGTGREERW